MQCKRFDSRDFPLTIYHPLRVPSFSLLSALSLSSAFRKPFAKGFAFEVNTTSMRRAVTPLPTCCPCSSILSLHFPYSSACFPCHSSSSFFAPFPHYSNILLPVSHFGIRFLIAYTHTHTHALSLSHLHIVLLAPPPAPPPPTWHTFRGAAQSLCGRN